MKQKAVEAEKLLLRAMLSSDVVALDRLLSSELVFTNHLGQVIGKGDDIAMHQSGALRFSRLDASEWRFNCGQQFVIASVRVETAGIYYGSSFELSLRYTRIWKFYDDGGIQLISGHSSEIKKTNEAIRGVH